jgi:hypothetical protein
MAVFLDTRGKTTLGIGICQRCSRKFSLDDLFPDRNYPGLRVCKDDLDDFDPYRLPARQPEVIALRFPRPDEPIIIEASICFLLLENGGELLQEDGSGLLLEFC